MISGLLSLAGAAILVVIDQLIKHWATAALLPVGSMDVLPGVVELRYCLNDGMAFSMLAGKQGLLIGMTSVMLLAVLIMLFVRKMPLTERAAWTLVLGGGVGNQGRLAVIRDLGEGDPYVGQVELVSGEIAEDLTNYYASSEQVPTVCALGVLVDKESGEAMLSGGLLIQALPGADNAALDRLEQNIAQLDSVTTMLAKGMGPEEMCRSALEGFEVEILDQAPVYYACNCSKERFARGLLTLGAKELLSLHGDEREQVETVCHYCNKKYVFTKAEIAELAKQAAKTGKKVF